MKSWLASYLRSLADWLHRLPSNRARPAATFEIYVREKPKDIENYQDVVFVPRVGWFGRDEADGPLVKIGGQS